MTGWARQQRGSGQHMGKQVQGTGSRRHRSSPGSPPLAKKPAASLGQVDFLL